MPELTFFEKGLSKLNPNWAMSRAMSREALTEFSSGGGRARSKDATLFEQASPEGWKKQRNRLKAIWEGRAMEEKLCLVSGILERLPQYVCQGMEYRSNTGDPKLDKQYEEYFHDWCGRADVTGRHRFGTMVELAFRAAIRDGEFGFVERVSGGELKLQSVTADRIGNPTTNVYDEKNINGIKLGSMGEVVAYEIYKRSLTNQYTLEGTVTPKKFIHLFFPKNPDEYHGVSKLAPVIPHAKDLYELLGYEKIAVKFAASWAGFIKSNDPHNKYSGTSWSSSGDGSSGKGRQNTMAAVPGAVARLHKDEEVQFAPGAQRPSGAFMALVDAIIREIAIGLNLPYGFVYNMAAFGGVTARLETKQAERVFAKYREILQNVILDRVKNKVLMLGIATKKIPGTPNWRNGSWKFGAEISGDVGHQTQADALLVQYGVKSRSKWAAELGEDFDNLLEENARELVRIREIAEEKGVPMDLLVSSMGSATEMFARMERAAAGESDEPEPAPGLVGVQSPQGVKPLLDVLEHHGKGLLDRESAAQTIMQLYGMTYARASKLLPVGV